MAADARKLVATAAEEGGDDSLIDALAPAPGADVSDQVQGLVEQAQALVRKAKKNEAAAKFREVLTLDRSNEDAVTFLEPYLRQTRKFQDLRDVLLTAARDSDRRRRAAQGVPPRGGGAVRDPAARRRNRHRRAQRAAGDRRDRRRRAQRSSSACWRRPSSGTSWRW